MRVMNRWNFMRILFLNLLVTVVGLLVVGCTAGGQAGTEPAADAEAGVDPELAGSEWVLSSLDGERPLAGTRITLEFDGPAATGNAGCNSYGAEIRTMRDGLFDVEEASRTAQGCQEPTGVMAQEDAYLEALVGSSGYRLQGDSLSLVDEAGEAGLVFSRKEETAADPADLVRSAWRLTSYNSEPPDVRRPITLVFGQNRFWGRSECRSYVGSYQATGDDIVFPDVSMLGEPCADEQLFLPESGDYQLEEGRLVLTGARGETYSYEALAANDAGAEDAGELVGPEWQLLGFIGPGETPAAIQEPLPGTALTASFGADGTVNGSAGCNTYSAVYEAAENTLLITNAVTTDMFCAEPQDVMVQEEQFATWLAEAGRFQSGGGLLWLDVGDDRALLFERRS